MRKLNKKNDTKFNLTIIDLILGLVFVNLKEHCANPNYGINGEEQYTLVAINNNPNGANDTAMEVTSVNGSNETEIANSTQLLNLTSTCSFSLSAPEDSYIRVIFNASNCTQWPTNCRIKIIDIEETDDEVNRSNLVC